MLREIPSSAGSVRRARLLPVLHLILTLILGLGAVAIAGLAATGRAHFGASAAKSNTEEKETEPEKDVKTEGKTGRYRIEKIEGFREVLQRLGAGETRLFGDVIQDAWAFRYSGGFVELNFETEVNGRTYRWGVIPQNWSRLMKRGAETAENEADSLHRQGFIALLAVPPVVPIDQALLSYHPQISGFMSGGPVGPLHVVPCTTFKVEHVFPYRLFLSVAPKDEQKQGTGYNLSTLYTPSLLTPLIQRDPFKEDHHTGGGVDLQPNKEILLLDRVRGFSRIKLKARFLGDGEARAKMKE